MKKILFHTLSLLMLGATVAGAQSVRQPSTHSAVQHPMHLTSEAVSHLKGSFAQSAPSLHGLPLSPMVTPPNASLLPIQGTFTQQSNGRALHNVQVDPSDPKKIHAVITGNLDLSQADADGSPVYASRRVLYTYSSDGGNTWKAPVTLGKVKSGYASLALLNRNGSYVPVIAGHQLTQAGATSLNCCLWIEKGMPGDGVFAECRADRKSFETGSTIDFLWPIIAVSQDNKSIYMLATTQATGGNYSQLEFGTFSLTATADSAKWNGWSALPGGGDLVNMPYAGWTTGGDYMMRIASDGRIGVLWKNMDIGGASGTGTADMGLYFVESTDGGKTWPATLQALVPIGNPQTIGSGTATLSPTSSFDFWYDGTLPKFFWMAYFADYSSNNDASWTYYPTTSTFFFWNPATMTSALDIATLGLTNPIDSLPMVFHSTQSTPYLELQGAPINMPTIGRTSDSNQFALFFQSYMNDDSMVVKTDTQYVFGSILVKETNDGGATWTDAHAFQQNLNVPLEKKIDYRYPQVSDWNPMGAKGPIYHTVFACDSVPGMYLTAGDVSFSTINYAHATYTPGPKSVSVATPASVVSLTNYPNPFTPQTTIAFTLRKDAPVTLSVEDMLGRPVSTLVNGRLAAGEHTVDFQAASLAAGVYRYTLRIGGETVSKSMTVIK